MIETITFNGNIYPAFQAEGFAAQWAFPFAKKVLSGVGFDIGCNREEWCFPGAIPIDPVINKDHCAYKLPKIVRNAEMTEVSLLESGEYGVSFTYNKDENKVDYIFSSHCIEHLNDWVGALDYWSENIRSGGQLFLYLPDMSEQQYWRPWNNRKHLHYLEPKILDWYFESRQEMWCNTLVTGFDLNASFYAIANKL